MRFYGCNLSPIAPRQVHDNYPPASANQSFSFLPRPLVKSYPHPAAGATPSSAADETPHLAPARCRTDPGIPCDGGGRGRGVVVEVVDGGQRGGGGDGDAPGGGRMRAQRTTSAAGTPSSREPTSCSSSSDGATSPPSGSPGTSSTPRNERRRSILRHPGTQIRGPHRTRYYPLRQRGRMVLPPCRTTPLLSISMRYSVLLQL